MRILRNIQKDIAELKRNTSDGLAEIRAGFNALAARMDDIEHYFTYTMGLTTQNKADIAKVSKQFRQDVKAIQDRLDELERT